MVNDFRQGYIMALHDIKNAIIDGRIYDATKVLDLVTVGMTNANDGYCSLRRDEE